MGNGGGGSSSFIVEAEKISRRYQQRNHRGLVAILNELRRLCHGCKMHTNVQQKMPETRSWRAIAM
jgi:hypothetical protein